MINKNYLIFAAAIALASCSVDEYMGENPEFTQTTKENIIGFGGGTGSMSRATSNTGPTNKMLDNQFLVYGWKTVKVGETTTTQKVFENYWVWYSTTQTPSQPDASSSGYNKTWEYVGNKNDDMPFDDPNTSTTPPTKAKLKNTQYIKYWDYSATDYKFVAGSPINQIEFKPSTGTNSDPNAIATAEVTGLAGHISPTGSATSKSQNPVYISAPIKITKNSTPTKYGDAVQLEFTRLQTKVRVGIYETIPGYSIESIEFYKYDGSSTSSDKFSIDGTYNNNVILTSATDDYFNGGANVKATVTYDWTSASAPTYTVTYAHGGTDTGYDPSQNWYGGQFANGVPATSSNPTEENAISNLYGEDNDMDDHGYFTVLSTTESPSPLVIKCDFTLTSLDGSGEIINVTGATAAIPAAYCKWDDNKMYTYIFKISQETNGHTGDEDHPGLIPITFDAYATATEEGVETIVQTPSITTHQQGAAVTANGIEYKTGTAIDITVMQDANIQTITNNTADNVGNVKVYYLGVNETTEAELVVNRPTTTTKIVSVDGKTAKFTPDASEITSTSTTPLYGYYAIEYCYQAPPSAAYKYKVIKVKRE